MARLASFNSKLIGKSNLPTKDLNLVQTDEPSYADYLIRKDVRELVTQKIRFHIEKSSENTAKSLKSDIGLYFNFCREHKHCAIPSETLTVRKFILNQAHIKAPSSINRYLASITTIHKLAELPSPVSSPEVQGALTQIKEHSKYRKKQAFGARKDKIYEIESKIDKSRARDVRDYAIILLAHSTLLRRSEIARIKVEDIEFDETTLEGTVYVDKIKSSAGTKEERYIYLSPKATQWVLNWVSISSVSEGNLFRSLTKYGSIRTKSLDGSQISESIKRMGRLVDIYLTGHSCRVGAAQDMVSKGIGIAKAMQAGRWKSHATFMGYVAKLEAKSSGMADVCKEDIAEEQTSKYNFSFQYSQN